MCLSVSLGTLQQQEAQVCHLHGSGAQAGTQVHRHLLQRTSQPPQRLQPTLSANFLETGNAGAQLPRHSSQSQ